MRKETDGSPIWTWFLLLLAGSFLVLSATAQDHSPLKGLPLEEALSSLGERGVQVLFTDRLVLSFMRVKEEPLSTDAEALLAELLTPHGLRAEELREGLFRVVKIEAPPAAKPATPRKAEIPVVEDEIEVRASRPWILGESLSTLSLKRDDLLALPHVGNDVLRGLTLLPGISSDDASARLSVRGGREDELLVLLDGVEILEPYHLKDFNSFLSVLPPQIIDSVELLTGAFSAEYGDRMSGVLNMTSIRPDGPRRFEIGLGPLDLRLTTSAGDEAGRHVINLRAGTLELPFRFADQVERPVFGDLYAKAERSLAEGTRDLSAGLLFSADRLRFSEIDDDEEEAFSTRYQNTFAWAADQRVRSANLLSTTRLSAAVIRRDRRGLEVEDGSGFDLRDDRELDSIGLEQEWTWQWGPDRVLKWGAELRRLEASYDYSAILQAAPPRLRADQSLTSFTGSFHGWQAAAYLSQRFRPSPKLGVEIGLRFDRNTVLDDNWILHPRLSADYQIAPKTRLSLSWGEYSQSQRLYELQVEDGLTGFSRVEQARYTSLGVETELPSRGISSKRRPPTLRVEAYRRDIGNPRARFENLFDPISKVPELEFDRFAFLPERTISQGVEIFLGGAVGRRLDGFISYIYADAFDRIDAAEIPRLNSQKHTVRLDIVWQTPWRWDVQAAWRSRSGRPTTGLSALPGADGEPVPVLGEINGGHLPDYHRLDLRLSRGWQLPGSELEVYFLIHNILGRRNLRGFDVSLSQDDQGATVDLQPETWGSALPTFGVRWSF